MSPTGERWRGELRASARLAAFAAYTSGALGAYEAARLVTPPARQAALVRFTKRTVAAHVLKLLGVEVAVRGGLPPAKGPRLVVANHRTALDIGVLMTHVAGHFVSRADVADWPVVGRLAQRAGTIFVDRASRHSGAAAIRAMRRALRAGRTVIVFPEGGTFRGDEVRPFRPGAFAALSGLEAEIVPAGLAYPSGIEYVGVSFAVHLRGVAARPRTLACLRFGTPFKAAGTSRDLAEAARDRVQELVREARCDLQGGA